MKSRPKFDTNFFSHSINQFSGRNVTGVMPANDVIISTLRSHSAFSIGENAIFDFSIFLEIFGSIYVNTFVRSEIAVKSS